MLLYANESTDSSEDDTKQTIKNYISSRTQATLEERDIVFFKPGVTLAMATSNPGTKHVIDFEQRFLSTVNLFLLMSDPQIDELNVPFESLDINDVLKMCRLSLEDTDNLHGIMSLIRNFLYFIESLTKMLMHTKVLFSEKEVDGVRVQQYTLRRVYQVLIRAHIISSEKFFSQTKSDKEKGITNEKAPLNESKKGKFTIQAEKYKVLFNNTTLEQVLKVFAENVENEGGKENLE